VMDEPTNDLDAETLELLEDLLVEYEGTLLLVSHDREFLDNVVTSTLVLEGDGRIGDYIGGYSDWLRLKALPPPPARNSAPAPKPAAAAPSGKKKKSLSAKEARDLADLPARIETLEKEQTALAAKLGDPAFYKREPGAFQAAKAQLEELERAHAEAFARWEKLEAAAPSGAR